MLKALIVGYGSIGTRHARLLSEMGVQIACVTGNAQCPYPVFSDIASAVGDFAPSHAVVSNITSQHRAALAEIESTGWRGPVLVEKPLFDQMPADPFTSSLELSIAYNLRFHPIVEMLSERVGNCKLISASFHVGQYLPHWRPGTDYSKTYSASRAAGGGVLLDLSHEIDLAQLLCGRFQFLTGIGGHFSSLAIDSDDVFHILGSCERCPAVSVELNYLNQMPRRVICLNGEGFTAIADLVEGKLNFNGQFTEFPPDRDLSYRRQIAAFVKGDSSRLCKLDEALAVYASIAAAKKGAGERQWVNVANFSTAPKAEEKMVSGARPNITLVGLGGHGKVVADLIRILDRFELIGGIDPARPGQVVYGSPVLGGDELLAQLHAEGLRHLALGIGDNALRNRLAQRALEMGFQLPALIAPSAYVAPTAVVGAGTVVFANATVQSDVSIGKFGIINSGAIVEHDCKLGDAVHVAPRAVLCGTVQVGDGCLIGAGTVIAPNLRVVAGIVTGAGTVVSNSLDKVGTYVGVPARLLRE